jgi:putative sugar O-methyltransferase
VAKHLKNFASHIEEFKKNDAIGNPVIFPYEQIGEISPTTLRYMKIVSDIEREFGTLDNLSICEIGVGYGGLCRIIDSYFKSVRSYCLVDLEPVLRIAQKYLHHFKINTSILYKTADDLETHETYDLVISNYAFTELRRDVQDIYLNKVILNSKRGYITYNDINPRDFNSYSIDELMAIIPNMRVLKEIELTDTRDRMLVWSEN